MESGPNARATDFARFGQLQLHGRADRALVRHRDAAPLGGTIFDLRPWRRIDALTLRQAVLGRPAG